MLIDNEIRKPANICISYVKPKMTNYERLHNLKKYTTYVKCILSLYNASKCDVEVVI